jgi:hypothetical protein
MNSIKLTGFLLLFLYLTGCDTWEPNTASMIGKIREIKNADKKTIGEFSYNCNGELKESWYTEDFYFDNERRKYSYTFNSKGQLIRKKGYEPGISFMSSMTGAMGKKVDYAYVYDSSGRIEQIKTDYTYDSDLKLDYSLQKSYQYPKDSIVVETTEYIYPSVNSVTSYLEYHFNSKGNIGKTISYYKVSENEYRVSVETTYTYDSENALFEPDPVPVSKNNFLTKTITTFNYNEFGNRIGTYSSLYHYEYTYNAEGFPKSRIETYPNGLNFTNYYKY